MLIMIKFNKLLIVNIQSILLSLETYLLDSVYKSNHKKISKLIYSISSVFFLYIKFQVIIKLEALVS